jgi:bile acid-coenzyme A ligase
MAVQSFGARLRELGAAQPDVIALVVVDPAGGRQELTWSAFDRWTEALAHDLVRRGTTVGTTVIVGFPNSVEHYIATWAAWKAGAMVLPLNAVAPEPEREAMIELAEPVVIFGDWQRADTLSRADVRRFEGVEVPALADVVPEPGKSVGSGGSTGRPKIIVDPSRWERDPDDVLGVLGVRVGFQHARVQLIPGPVFHNMPFSWSHLGLFLAQRVVVMEKFDARRMLELIETERVEYMTVVPTMMRRVAELPDRARYDLSSFRGILHSAAVCPVWVKQAWLELVKPEVLHEGFGATEAIGIIVISGDEWLEHVGSVGKPFGTELRILGEDGQELPPGEVGEVYTRPIGATAPTYRYIGSAPLPTTPDGFMSVGDLGWLDEDGYLFVADRRVDLIITGGSNVYPAEVEAVLSSHPEVDDVVVIGLPDPDWGKRVHAIVQPRDPAAPPSYDDLRSYCAAQLTSYKVPKSVELMNELPRDEAGKIRRRALVEERTPATAGAPVGQPS